MRISCPRSEATTLEPLHEHVEPIARVARAARDALCDALDELRVHSVEHRGEQPLLAAEVPVERGLLDAGRACDVVDAGRRVAALREVLERGVEDPVAADHPLQLPPVRDLRLRARKRRALRARLALCVASFFRLRLGQFAPRDRVSEADPTPSARPEAQSYKLPYRSVQIFLVSLRAPVRRCSRSTSLGGNPWHGRIDGSYVHSRVWR